MPQNPPKSSTPTRSVARRLSHQTNGACKPPATGAPSVITIAIDPGTTKANHTGIAVFLGMDLVYSNAFDVTDRLALDDLRFHLTFLLNYVPRLSLVGSIVFVAEVPQHGTHKTRAVLNRFAAFLYGLLAESKWHLSSLTVEKARYITPREWRTKVFGNVGRLERSEWKSLAIKTVRKKYKIKTISPDEAEAILIGDSVVNA
ncbi:MAG: hypothetical protein MN733_02695 [Nitrososphaera sp.]|nr:hypothetical protein [Nitrososphaera sp.]